MSTKKLNRKIHIAEGKITFNLVEEHPSHKYMVISKQNIYIPCIKNLNSLPNIVDLRIGSMAIEVNTSMKREEYAKHYLTTFLPL